MDNFGISDILDFYNTKDDAPSFQTEDEARDWAESLKMSKYGLCFCYIDGRFTCIADCGQSEDGYRGAIESVIDTFLKLCGLTDYSDTEEAAVDIGAEATSIMYDYLERNGIMDFIWLYDTF